MVINAKQEPASVMSWTSLCIFLMILVLMFSMVTPSHGVIAEAAVLVPVVIAALAAFGIVTGAHAIASGDVVSWYSQKLDAWASSVGESVSVLLDLSKVATTPLGALSLAPSFLFQVKAFAQWLQQDQSIQTGGTPVVIRMGNFSDQPIPYLTNTSAANIVANGILINGNSSYLNYFASNASSPDLYVACYDNYAVIISTGGGLSNVVWAIKGSGNPWIPSLSYSSAGNQTVGGVTYRYGTIQITNATNPTWAVPRFSTLSECVTAAANYLNGQGSAMTLNPGVIAYPETTGDDEDDYPYIIDYGGVAGDTVQDASDTIMDRVIDNDLVVEGETDAPAEAIDWPDIMSPPQVQGLDDVFPFCIPFDIYHFLQALSATPVAPRFEIPFYIPNLINYTMVIDLSGFDTAAQVLRTMELLAFCIGLAFVTRKLIRG